jgi:hypothetical protein
MQLDLRFAAQRHTNKRTTYVPPRDPIDPERYTVDEIANDTTCKNFVLQHHYSSSFPAAIASFGLFETAPAMHSILVGIACFSVPMNTGSNIKSLLEAGETQCELGRFVLTDEVGQNAETWMIRRALRGLAATKRIPDGQGGTKPKHPICVSFSDPVPRYAQDGRVAFHGHFGKIYGIAGNATYLGRSKPKLMYVCRDGTAIVSRTLNKLRNNESGSEHVYKHLIKMGAPAIQSGEDEKEYVVRALREGPFQPVRHRGNHKYNWALGSHTRKRKIRAALDQDLPYPTHTDAC